MRTAGNKRVVSDDACKDLVRHFNRYRLCNEDFQFSDLLGAAYEFLINMFAESAGKKGGDFYTPRDVIRLMVRLIKPRPGLSVYDPTCGSGGMLIISREFIEQSGGDPTNVRLCGQVNDASAWSICKLNMLLHGVPGADIQLADTLLHPMHREAGELERFDRVIANPPFSQNYTRSNMEFPERFRWGWCPTTGKKGDLMFAQHMLAVCKPGGMVTTVMPHGVLFRGGAEKEIRKKFLEQDLIEAIIGLPQNLFYGAGIPACILVMRPNLTGQSPNPNKPAPAAARCSSSMLTLSFTPVARRTICVPSTSRRSSPPLTASRTCPATPDAYRWRRSAARPMIGTSTSAAMWTTRRRPNHTTCAPICWAAYPWPRCKRSGRSSTRSALTSHAFTARTNDAAYFDFAPALADRSAIRSLVENDAGVQARAQALRDALMAWWTAHAPRLADLPAHRELNRVRAEFLDTFGAALCRWACSTASSSRVSSPPGGLTRCPTSRPCSKTVSPASSMVGWTPSPTQWRTTKPPARPSTLRPQARPPHHGRLPERIATAKADIARLKGEKEAFEQSNAPDDADEEELENWNYAKDLERQMRELKAENKETLKELARLERAAARARATDCRRRLLPKPRPHSNPCSTASPPLKPHSRPTSGSRHNSLKPVPVTGS